MQRTSLSLIHDVIMNCYRFLKNPHMILSRPLRYPPLLAGSTF